MDIDEFMEKLNDIGNDLDLWQEGIEVRLPDGTQVTGFHFDGNTGLILEAADTVDGGF